MSRKAQLWSLDFVVSLMIFLSAVVAVLFSWNYISANAAETQALKELQLKVMTLSDSLIRTQGLPVNWGNATVEVFGLAETENVLNATKLAILVNMSTYEYDRARAILDLGAYDFYLEAKDLNGTVFGNTSKPLASNAGVVIPIERFAMYGGRIARVKLIIWG